MFMAPRLTRCEGSKSWWMSKPCTPAVIFFCLILLLGVSCQHEEITPPMGKVTVMDYFPLRFGNQWTYTVEGISEGGEISSTATEKWIINTDLFIDLYEVTPAGVDFIGFKATYLQDDLEINDIIGTYISLKYIDLPSDSLVLVASDSLQILRERWIKGGLTNLKTSFGDLACICTKTTYHFPGDRQEEYLYFCKDIGIYRQEKNYIVVDQADSSYVGFSWRRTLTEFQIK